MLSLLFECLFFKMCTSLTQFLKLYQIIFNMLKRAIIMSSAEMAVVVSFIYSKIIFLDQTDFFSFVTLTVGR